MTVREWLSRQGMTQEQAAHLVGAKPRSFRRYLAGRRWPLDLALRLVAVSKGAVTLETLAASSCNPPTRRAA